MINFFDISYLTFGNQRQKNTYSLLKEYRIIDLLAEFDPILVGTIPIEIDIENSDIDIVCFAPDRHRFSEILNLHFSYFDHFNLSHNSKFEAVKANFYIDGQEVEIFGQGIPTTEQNGYKHMLIEYQLLIQYGSDFRNKVINLKKQGYKTEPAFAALLGLSGDPYEALLSL